MSCRKNGHKNIFSVWYYFFGCISYPLCSFLSLLWLTFFGFRVTYFLNDAIGVWLWMYVELGLRILIVQEQPSRVVFKKRCSENMQQIYRRTPIPKCDFNKVASQFWHDCSPVNLLRIFRTPFLKTPLDGCFWIVL